MDIEKEHLLANDIAKRVSEAGGRAYFVGGYVRDGILGIENKDIDIEVHGIEPAILEGILDSVGTRMAIGESFGIYNIKGYSIDIAMPRKEENRGKGHKDFDICVDPYAGTYNAALRRDFTINAMMQDVLTGEIVDHFGGQEDLKNKIIRHVNGDTFAEDELRVLRAAQFAARFEFDIADETYQLCQNMALENLPQERVMAEMTKALMKANKPSIFFEVLRKMNQLDYWFPELKVLIGTPQNVRFHQEGDVWIHTMMVLDAAATLRDNVPDKLAFMLSALCHDLGKPITTTVDEEGIVHSYNHEIQGLPIVKQFIRRLTGEVKLCKVVVNTVSLHMRPNVLAGNKASISATNRMFDKAMDPIGLIYLAEADFKGMKAPIELPNYTEYLFDRLETYREYMSRPYVQGKDLIEAGLKPSDKFKEYLEVAHKLRVGGVSKKGQLGQVLAMARKESKNK